MSSYGLGRRQFLTTAIGVAAGWTQVSENAVAAPQREEASHANSVRVWLTDVSAEKWVAPQSAVRFETKRTANPLTIKIDDSVTYQRVQGFGAAMTDSAAWLINKLPSADRTKLMHELFDPSTGIGLSMVRSPMGATDFNASGSYSYDDMPAGQTDPALSHFSVQHDEAGEFADSWRGQPLNPRVVARLKTGTRAGSCMPAGMRLLSDLWGSLACGGGGCSRCARRPRRDGVLAGGVV
ncbi:hypothetical protein [Streptomyces sp. NBC_00453]|uniref:hypothetical protein n=1 Tax=Streptomyces sp. NBC_00453 TaxID=2903653 RepID=UPI002E22AE77